MRGEALLRGVLLGLVQVGLVHHFHGGPVRDQARFTLQTFLFAAAPDGSFRGGSLDGVVVIVHYEFGVLLRSIKVDYT